MGRCEDKRCEMATMIMDRYRKEMNEKNKRKGLRRNEKTVGAKWCNKENRLILLYYPLRYRIWAWPLHFNCCSQMPKSKNRGCLV
jgi:hypothetical protein